MGVVLVNSVSITITSNGFSCQRHSKSPGCHKHRIGRLHRLVHNSAIKANRKYANPSMVSVPEKGPFGFEIMQPRMINMNFLYESTRRINNFLLLSNLVGSVESGLVCDEDERKTLIQRREEEFDPILENKKLPPWGNFPIEQDTDLEPKDNRHTSTLSEGTVNMIDNRVHILEETDEQILSQRIFKLSRSNKVRSALELYRSMDSCGLQPNVHACNSLLSCLLRNEMLNDALRFFEFMKTNGITTGHTYSLILKAVANVLGCDSALKMFVELEGDCIQQKKFDIIVYNTMISVCGKTNNWVQTERIWRSMKEKGHIGTMITYRLLVCIFVRCGQNELALDAYTEMTQNRLEPGEDAMQAIIGASTKEGRWDLALDVFQNMLNNGLKPNSISFNALINSLGKAGKMEPALKVFEIMKSSGHIPDAYTWNALLGALYRSNQYADVLQLFETIKREHSSALNSHLYNTALMSCRKLRLWNKALQLLWEMETSGLSVSTASYNLVIGACETARKPKVALQVYEHMVHKKCTPDTFTHLSLIRGCIWGSLWDEMEEILNRIPPDVSCYNAVINGMCLRGKFESAKKLYQKMHENGLQPDGKTRAWMLQKLPKQIRQKKRRY